MQMERLIKRSLRERCIFAAFFVACSAASAQSVSVPIADSYSGHPRVAIISDIGNEPDDQMSFVRLLLYSNEFDLEAMIASTSTWQRTKTHPETMHSIVEAYRQVRPNLLLHAKGWPTAEELDQRIFAGQPAYGMEATGAGKASAGSGALAKAIERDDPRPLWICLWGGVNTLAQALMDLRAAHSASEMDGLSLVCASHRSPIRTTPALDSPRVPTSSMSSSPALRMARNTMKPPGPASAEISITATEQEPTPVSSPTSGSKQIFAPRGRWANGIRDSCSSWKVILRRIWE